MDVSPEHIDITDDTGGDQYLIFLLDGHLYGTPLLSVREIILPQEYNHVPNTSDYILGMINLRGKILSVIDLRVRFKLNPSQSRYNALLVFENSAGTFAALVDRVVEVAYISEDLISSDAPVSLSIPASWRSGVGKYKEKLITLLQLDQAMIGEEIFDLDQSRLNPDQSIS